MELIIVSGRSGSGKSVALRVLEDLGYYCVDNIPVILLPSLVRSVSANYDKIAVSIDVRNLPKNSMNLTTFSLTCLSLLSLRCFTLIVTNKR